MDNLAYLVQSVQTLFGSLACQAALATGFVKRKSKLSAELFLTILVAGFIHKPNSSYADLAAFADLLGLDISRQGLEERLNTPQALAFLQRMLDHSLERLKLPPTLVLPFSALARFPMVLIQDSTTIALPYQLATLYPACGGGKIKATTKLKGAIKLQTTLDARSGLVQNITEQNARQPDQAHHDFLNNVQAGTLVLFDLGYFSQKGLKKVDSQNARFVCRLNTQCSLYRPKADGSGLERFELLDYLKKTRKVMSLTQPLELEVVVGASLKLVLRLVITKLPKEAQAARTERLTSKSKTKGSDHKYTHKHLAYARYNIYVTNTKVAELSGAEVVAMYTMRWQIELMFKQWKSQAGVENVAGKQAGRVMGEIYAKLIGLVLYMYLRQGVSGGGWLQEQSPWRGWEIWKGWMSWERVSLSWLGRSASSQKKLKQSLEKLRGRLAKYAKLESYPKRLSSLKRLEQATRYGQLSKQGRSKGRKCQTKSLA